MSGIAVVTVIFMVISSGIQSFYSWKHGEKYGIFIDLLLTLSSSYLLIISMMFLWTVVEVTIEDYMIRQTGIRKVLIVKNCKNLTLSEKEEIKKQYKKEMHEIIFDEKEGEINDI